MEEAKISEKQFKKMQEDLTEMQTKYTNLSNDMKTLKAGQAGIQADMNSLNGQYEKINSNMEAIMNKLNAISEDHQKSTIGKMMREKDGLLSRMVKKPLRKLAIGTVGAVMAMADYAAEKASGAKEGLEDIVAEASYNNKKRRSRMSEEMDPSEA